EYDVAAEQSPVSIGLRGLFPREIIHILESVTGVTWLGPRFAWWRPIKGVVNNDSPVVVTIRRPWKWRTLHCVAVYKGYAYDPEYHCRMPMNESQRRHWRVVDLYLPEAVDQLMAVREHRKRQKSGMRAAIPRRAKHRW